LSKVLNKQLFIEINPRLNDLNNFLQIIRLFLCWLQQNLNKREFCLNLSKFYFSRDSLRLEPWDLRGGITNELKVRSAFSFFHSLLKIFL
jgi:hypothetical protein